MGNDPELAAVESALSALALAGTDGALERAINRLLPGLLMSLGTKSAPARARIIQALQHINVRVRGAPALKLPFAATLAAAADANANPMTANVALQGGYVARCFERLTPTERTGALSPLVRAAGSLAVRSKANVDVILSLAVRSLGSARGRWEALADCPDAAVLLLFEYGLRALRGSTKVSHPAPELAHFVGLCLEYAGVKQPDRAARVLPQLLVAAGYPTDSTLAEAGVNALKRLDGTELLLEHRPGLVDVFFELFTAPDAGPALRAVVLQKGLLRAPPSAGRFPEVLTVLELAVYTDQGLGMRLRAAGLQYLSYVIKHAPKAALVANEEALRSRMTHVIRNPGSVPAAVRAFMYTALVQLIQRIPDSVSKHDGFLPELLFNAAQDKNETVEARASASSALCVLAGVYTSPNADETEKILALLKTTIGNLANEASGARASAILWANECFPFSNARARLLNIAACADQRTDVRDAALAGLNPKKFRSLALMRDMPLQGSSSNENHSSGSSSSPNFSEIVMTICDEAQNDEGLKFYQEAWASFFHFALRTLKENARGDGEIGELATLVKYVGNNFQVKAALDRMRSKADEFILDVKLPSSARIKRSALGVVLTVAQIELGNSSVGTAFSPHIPLLIESCTRSSTSGDVSVVEAYAALVGVASTALPEKEALELIESLGSGLEPPASGGLDTKQGEHDRVAKLLVLGHVITEQTQRGKKSAFSDDVVNAAKKVVCRVRQSVEPSTSVRVAAMRAITLLGVLGPLFTVQDTDMVDIAHSSPIAEVAKVATSTKSEPAVVEAACSALGGICVGEPTDENVAAAAQALFDITKVKSEDEVQFTAAESLAQVASGLNIPPPRLLDDASKDAEEDDLQELLQRRGVPLTSFKSDRPSSGKKITFYGQEITGDIPGILEGCVKLCTNPRPYVRSFGVVFLFTFLKLIGSENSSDLSEKYNFATPRDEKLFRSVQKHVGIMLPKAQKCFMTLLSDRTEVVQQISSRGISLVYELSPEGAREDLVHSLVHSLTSTTLRSGSTVAGDEAALMDFPEIEKGTSYSKSGDSKGGATYKELCSLAQDMGKPELVYKFMNIAGHASLWNSRRGAALAGSSLLNTEVAAKQLKPHAATLLPRLYVYAYDPAEGVRIAMSAVLQSVVKAAGYKSVAAALNDNLDDVLKHCLKSITSRQGRVREAGCTAIRNCLTGRRWAEVEEWFKEVWYTCLRAMDDMTEAVRNAARSFGEELSSLSETLCNPEHSGLENASKAVEIAVPALLECFTHSVDNVRALGASTLGKILKYGGEALKTSIPDIAQRMLESASEFEAGVLNWLHFQVDDKTKEELETLRARAASQSNSAWMESLNRIIVLVDESVAKTLVPKVVSVARSGVGPGTRSATARFIASLVKSRGHVMKKYGPRLMRTCLAAARVDQGVSLRRSWCAALAEAAKISSASSVNKICDEILDLGGSDEAKDRTLASFLAYGLWHHATDTAKAHGTAILPVAYMGIFEVDCREEVVANWVDVWSEGCPSSDAGLRMYASEICDICLDKIASSNQYKVRQCSAKVLGALAEASNASTSVEMLAKAGDSLLKALPARLFDGKESFLDALGAIAECSIGKEVYGRIGGPEKIVQAILKECFRGKKPYRLAALSTLANILKGTRSSSLDFFPVVIEKVSPLWVAPDSESDKVTPITSGSDAQAVLERNNARKAFRTAMVSALSCVEAAYIGAESVDKHAQKAHFMALVEGFGVAMPYERDVRQPVLESLTEAVARSEASLLMDGDITPSVMQYATLGVQDTRFANVRRAGIALLDKFRQKVGIKNFKTAIGKDLTVLIMAMAKRESDSSVQADAEALKSFLK